MKTILLSLLLLVSASHALATDPKIPDSLAYEIHGKGDTTLLFVHGWCIDKSYWDAQVNAFKSKYRIVTVDLAGHGASTRVHENWSMKNFAEDIAELVKVLKLKNIVLIGHSMAANINLYVYDMMPEHIIGFVAVENFRDLGTELNHEQEEAFETFIDMLEDDYAAAVSIYANAHGFTEATKEPVRQKVTKDYLEANREMAVRSIEVYTMEERINERKMAAGLALPLYIINSYPPLTKQAPLKMYCKAGYKLYEVQGTGHYPMVEQPESFNKKLNQVLSDIAKKRN